MVRKLFCRSSRVLVQDMNVIIFCRSCVRMRILDLPGESSCNLLCLIGCLGILRSVYRIILCSIVKYYGIRLILSLCLSMAPGWSG